MFLYHLKVTAINRSNFFKPRQVLHKNTLLPTSFIRGIRLWLSATRQFTQDYKDYE